jgi:hypothetical protein
MTGLRPSRSAVPLRIWQERETVGIFSSRDWALESSVPGQGAVVEAGQHWKLDLGLLIAAMTGFLSDQQLRGSGFLTLTFSSYCRSVCSC